MRKLHTVHAAVLLIQRTMSSLLFGVILVLFGFIFFLPQGYAQEKEVTQCKTSPNVEAELTLMDRSLTELSKKITDSCSNDLQGNKRGYKEAYLELLSIGVDSETWKYSLRKLVDIDENEALSHDMQLYYQKLRAFDQLAKRAANSCSDIVFEIKRTKEIFYNGEFVSPNSWSGYRALRLAEKSEIQVGDKTFDNYFFQQQPGTEVGYYDRSSPFACSSNQYEFKDIKTIFTRFRDTLKQFRERGEQLKAREGSVLLREFQAQLSASIGIRLITVEEANRRLAQSCGTERGNSYRALFENLKTCIGNELKTSPDIREKDFNELTNKQNPPAPAPSDTSTESLLDQRDISRHNDDLVREISANNEKYALLYNRDYFARNHEMETILESADTTISDYLCDTVQKTAESMRAFCLKCVTNKPSACEKIDPKAVSCK